MRLRKGLFVLIEFMDHCESKGKPAGLVRMRAVGWIHSVKPRRVILTMCEAPEEDAETRDCSETRYTIHRGTIQRVVPLPEL